MPARCCAPIPNNCSAFPAGKVPILKRRCCCSEFELHPRSRCFSVPIPMSRWYNNPNNSSAFPRFRRWRPRSPDYPEHFPMRKRPTAPAKQSSYSAGLSLSAVTGICSASMGVSAGVTSFMRFLARSINSCSCSTI